MLAEHQNGLQKSIYKIFTGPLWTQTGNVIMESSIRAHDMVNEYCYEIASGLSSDPFGPLQIAVS